MPLTELEEKVFGALGVQSVLIEPGPQPAFDKVEWDRKTMEVTGYVILIRKPGDTAVYGPVENSFSLGDRAGYTQLFWNSRWRDKEGNLLPKDKQVDGLEWAKRTLDGYRKSHPDWAYELYNIKDADKLPVIIDWTAYCRANEPAASLSGVRDKYGARNLRFTLKPERCGL